MVKVAVSLAIAFAAILCMVINAWIMPHPSSYDAPRNSPSPMVDLDGDDIRESDEWLGLWIEEDSPLWDCRTMGNLTCGDTYYGD